MEDSQRLEQLVTGQGSWTSEQNKRIKINSKLFYLSFSCREMAKNKTKPIDVSAFDFYITIYILDIVFLKWGVDPLECVWRLNVIEISPLVNKYTSF